MERCFLSSIFKKYSKVQYTTVHNTYTQRIFVDMLGNIIRLRIYVNISWKFLLRIVRQLNTLKSAFNGSKVNKSAVILETLSSIFSIFDLLKCSKSHPRVLT